MTGPRPRLRLEIRARLDSLGPQWDELLSTQQLPTPFLKSWWIDNASGATPAVLCCFAGARLVGGAAFEMDRVGRGPITIERVRCVGQGVLAPDHLDLISDPQHHAEVLDLVLGWVRRPGSRVIDLDGMAATGSLASAFSAHEVERIGAPFAPLPDNGADYLAARPGQLRNTITRARKRFTRDGAEVRRVQPDDVSDALNRLSLLHDQRWSDASSFLRDWERCRAAALAGAACGDVVIHELVAADGDVIATELDLLAGPRLAFYQAGRRIDHDARGCGSVLRAALIDWACAEGMDEYDLLRGDERYKADWAAERRELVRCRVGIGTRGRIMDAAYRLRHRSAPALDRARAATRSALSPAAWRRRPATHDGLSG